MKNCPVLIFKLKLRPNFDSVKALDMLLPYLKHLHNKVGENMNIQTSLIRCSTAIFQTKLHTETDRYTHVLMLPPGNSEPKQIVTYQVIFAGITSLRKLGSW